MMLVRLAAVFLAAFVLVSPVRAQETVDPELVLLADATGSIDNAEIRFQREGYAAAITSAEVLNAIAGGIHQRIAVTYVEWGSENSQQVVAPWTIIASEAVARRFAETLLATRRLAYGPNAIGSALAFGAAPAPSSSPPTAAPPSPTPCAASWCWRLPGECRGRGRPGPEGEC